MKTTLYIFASDMNNWEEGYESVFPYRIQYSFDSHESKYRWLVDQTEIEFNLPMITCEQVVLDQIRQLEGELRKESDAYVEATVRIKDKIASLMALPAPVTIDIADDAEPDHVIELEGDDVPF